MSAPGSSPADAVPPATAIQAAARLLADGQVEDALVQLRALAQAAPAYPVAQVLLAKACEAAGHWADALAAWQEAYVLVPSSPLVRRERQRLLDAHARATEASSVLEPPTLEPPPQEDTAEAPAEARTAPEEPEAVEAAPSSESERAAADDSARAETSAETEAVEEAPAAATEPAPEAPEGPAADQEVPPLDESEEALIVPPNISEGAGEGEDDLGDEGDWREGPVEAPPPEPEANEEDWAVVEEADAAPVLDAADAVVEPRIAPPDEPDVPPPAPPEEEVEDAHILFESSGDADAPEAPPARTLADELDDLIEQLEEAPRIRPDPDFSGPDVLFDEEIADDMVSETLARIYAAQQQYAQAAIVYEKLAQQKPEQAEALRAKAAEMRAQERGG